MELFLLVVLVERKYKTYSLGVEGDISHDELIVYAVGRSGLICERQKGTRRWEPVKHGHSIRADIYIDIAINLKEYPSVTSTIIHADDELLPLLEQLAYETSPFPRKK